MIAQSALHRVIELDIISKNGWPWIQEIKGALGQVSSNVTFMHQPQLPYVK